MESVNLQFTSYKENTDQLALSCHGEHASMLSVFEDRSKTYRYAAIRQIRSASTEVCGTNAHQAFQQLPLQSKALRSSRLFLSVLHGTRLSRHSVRKEMVLAGQPRHTFRCAYLETSQRYAIAKRRKAYAVKYIMDYYGSAHR